LLIPSVVSVLWMTAFGGSASTMLGQGYQAIADAPLELKLFSMLDNMALAGLTSFLAIVLVIVFFVTSSDSGSLVIDTITAGGQVDAPVAQRVFWAIFEGMVAVALLLGGGLGALQAASVSTGLPFAAVLLGFYALVRGLLSEPRRGSRPAPRAARSARGQAVERHLRRAAGDQVGHDSGRAARHRPPHVAVAGIVIEVAVAAAADDRRAIRRHRPQAGPVARLREIAGVRVQVP
jgi:choline-glycine betaine transporter